MPDIKAQAKYQRVSPRKVRLVVGLLRNLSIPDARNQLFALPKASAVIVRKVLDSAVANAVHNNKLSADDLVITQAFVDGGPTLKRWQPRAFGRASAIRKRTSHITIMVGEKKSVVSPKSAARGEKKTAPAAAKKEAPKKSAPKKDTH